ncbi:MAG TPA: hypothetical protein ACFCUC_03750 [Desulfobacterales bacterium]
MAPQSKGDSFAEEVENRLQSIFGEEDTGDSWEEETVDKDGQEAMPEPEQAAETESETDTAWEEPSSEEIQDPLRKLKTIVLSIDWEINETVMTGFVEQVGVLQDHYRDDKIVLVFLQLLGSLGEYIRVNLAKSHPESFQVLNSLFNQLESIAGAEHLSEAEKKKVLSQELARYKKLKAKLASPVAKTTVEKRPPEVKPVEVKSIEAKPVDGKPVESKPVEADAPETSPRAGAPPVAKLIAELKSSLMAEIKALRMEIRQLKEALAKRN